MLNLRDSDIEFIKKNIGDDSFLLTTDNRREFLIGLNDWILDYGFDETGWTIIRSEEKRNVYMIMFVSIVNCCICFTLTTVGVFLLLKSRLKI